MKFSLTQIVKTNDSDDHVLLMVVEVFQTLALKLERNNQVIIAESLQATFGSGLRNDVTRFTFKSMRNGVLVTANTEFKPSHWFWICLVIGLVTVWGWVFLLPMYFYQMYLVKKTIENGLKRVSDEQEELPVEASMVHPRNGTGSNAVDEIERLAGLLKKGLIDKSEFDAAKRKALGIESAASIPQSDPFLEDNADPLIYVQRGGVVQKPYARSLLVKNFAKLVATDEFSYSPDGPWSPRDGFFS